MEKKGKTKNWRRHTLFYPLNMYYVAEFPLVNSGGDINLNLEHKLIKIISQLLMYASSFLLVYFR